MIFYYIRHGDPIYNPDSLTPLGERQAEAVAKRLALHGLDRIYSSTSNRAILTAKPTCELLKKEATLLDFAEEGHAYKDFSIVDKDGRKQWFFANDEMRKNITDESMIKLGFKWYEHEAFKGGNFEKGIERVYNEADTFFASLGYEHIRYTGKYKITKPNSERVALFAHQGFGVALLSCILDIPLPTFATRFDICHSGMSVVEFGEDGEYTIPKVLTLSSDSHIYREGLPTKYNNYIYL